MNLTSDILMLLRDVTTLALCFAAADLWRRHVELRAHYVRLQSSHEFLAMSNAFALAITSDRLSQLESVAHQPVAIEPIVLEVVRSLNSSCQQAKPKKTGDSTTDFLTTMIPDEDERSEKKG